MQLLARLKISFLGIAADVDEPPRAEETPPQLAARLAESKPTRSPPPTGVFSASPAALPPPPNSCAGSPAGRRSL
jgi:hypothetical protein